MSKVTRGSYPHPVLDASDDVGASIEVFNVSVAPSVDDVEVRFQLRMTEPLIHKLLQEGAARYSFRWSCSLVMSRPRKYSPDPLSGAAAPVCRVCSRPGSAGRSALARRWSGRACC